MTEIAISPESDISGSARDNSESVERKSRLQIARNLISSTNQLVADTKIPPIEGAVSENLTEQEEVIRRAVNRFHCAFAVFLGSMPFFLKDFIASSGPDEVTMGIIAAAASGIALEVAMILQKRQKSNIKDQFRDIAPIVRKKLQELNVSMTLPEAIRCQIEQLTEQTESLTEERYTC